MIDPSFSSSFVSMAGYAIGLVDEDDRRFEPMINEN
jgi:hypothetical protein